MPKKAQARRTSRQASEESAKRPATTALALDPGSPGIYPVLSYISNATGGPDQAIDYLERERACVHRAIMYKLTLRKMGLRRS